MPVTEDRVGYDALLKALGDAPVLIAMETTGHYWKNLFAVLAASGHDVALLDPFLARRFQDASLERTKTDAIDAQGLARFAFEKRPKPSHLHDAVAQALRELVRHRDRLRQDFDDRVRQLHRLVDLGFPKFTSIASRSAVERGEVRLDAFSTRRDQAAFSIG
jgi:transposase